MYGYNSYGYGGGYGGGQQTQMMSSLSSSLSLCMAVAVAGFVAYNYIKKENEEKEQARIEEEERKAAAAAAAATVTDTVPSNALNDLDGAKAITIGGLAMSIQGNCSNNQVVFTQPSDSKTAWYVIKAGTKNGKDFYLLQSYHKSFNTYCKKQYLTAPPRCSGSPYLAEARSSPDQYWYIVSNGARGYSLQSMACHLQAHQNSYLVSSGAVSTEGGKKRPTFAMRPATSFAIESPFTA